MLSRQKVLLALSLATMAIAPALAGPNGATVINGNATIQGQGTSSVTINQTSQNAIINFQTFNISTNESVKILMPNSNSTELDRVIGNLGPSLINGSLTSNGRVFLVNPDGILFGPGAQINVGSLLATTSDISNANFMAGRYNFNIPGNPSASIVNQGTITAQTGGFAALVAPGVRNTGTITAWLGRVGLVSANTFALDLYGDHLIQLDVNDSIAAQVIDVSTGKPLKSLVSNEGTLKASGGRVELSAAAARQVVDSVINNSGVIEANSIGSRNGMIVLSAATASGKPAGAPAQTVRVAGKLSAAGKDADTTGGTVVITGENIALNGATVDASGYAGGGTVLIGGNGNAANGSRGNGNNTGSGLAGIGPAGTVNGNSATGSSGIWNGGNGGWSGGLAGSSGGSANGNSATGSNGFWNAGIASGAWSSGNANSGAAQITNSAINKSAASALQITSNTSNVTIDAATVIDASATVNGNGGKVTIWSDGATAFNGTILARGGAQGGNGGFVETSGQSLTFSGTVDTSAANGKAGTWLLDPTNLTIDSVAAGKIISSLDGGNVIIFTHADGSTSGNGNTSPGDGNITIDAPIAWNSHNTLTIDAYNAIIFNASITVRGTGGLVLTAANNPLAPAAPLISFNNGANVQFTGAPGRGQSLTINGQGYTLLYSVSDVQNINSNLSGHYALALGLDASAVTSWTPLGTDGAGNILGAGFTGSFQGLGNTISNLKINQPNVSEVGLFGFVGGGGLVQNIGLVGGSVNGFGNVGALIGENLGTLANSYATASVAAFADAGGLIGLNTGTVTQSYASGPVTAGGFVGGLAGVNSGAITQSYATGPVTGNNTPGVVGGLVGFNGPGATISDSHATGNVDGNGAFATGGLAGENAGTISTSYATGTVTNGATFGFWVGGLVGTNDSGASITQSYATGAVTGSGDGGFFFGGAGGLAGLNSGTISQSHATGAVTVDAFSTAGGLVGINGNCCDKNGNPIVGASIANSYATGAVSSSGIDVTLGGLVGMNLPGGVISNSQALGNVTATANLQPNNGTNCIILANCQFLNVGGFVGQNYGTINGTAWATRPGGCTAGSSFTCASGNVSVGSLGQGGGFAGFNQGIISFAFATGSVNGAPGQLSTNTNDNFSKSTQLGGFVGDNQGMISNSFATGNVGSAGTAFLGVGGFAASNEGIITHSLATGAVLAGDSSQAGGFVGSNSPSDFTVACPLCFVGDGFNNTAAISNSQAFGSVTVGASSVAGGFASTSGSSKGTGGGSFNNITASGAVTSGHDSIVGGLVGVVGDDTTLSNSFAQNTLVASTGSNSIIGGVAGINVGTISNTESSAPVSGTSDSYIGGIAGINLGVLNNVVTDPAIIGSGDHNFIGGIAGLNVGSISNSTAQVTITGDSTSYVGGVAGVNGSYTGVTLTIPGSSFPNGTITNSSASGTGFTGAVGTTSPAFVPALPGVLAGCTDTICKVLINGTLPQNPNPPQNPTPPQDSLPNQQTTQLTQNLNLNNPNSTPPPILTSVDVNAATNGGPAGTGTGNTNSNGNNNSGNAGLATGKNGGNGAPFGMRLIDMPRMPLPPGTGMPPLGETHFLFDRLMLQFDATLSPQQIEELIRRYGLVIEAQQTIGMLGRPVYTVRIGNGQSVRDVIQAMQGTGVAVQPQYTYGLTQDDNAANDNAANQGDGGDPAQYAVRKLQLAAAHRISKGDNVVIAVIDSAIDADQPDLAGRVIDRYDAGCGVTAPDAHGTGMAGAIASHAQLLGVAPSAKIIAICAFGGSGGTPEATSVKIIRGLDYAVQHGAKIVNMSFAGPYDPALAQALQVTREKGVLIVAAAGNAGAKSPPLYPGADPNVMAITATDERDRLFAGANQGKYVALAAPGVNILVPAPNGGVQMTTGTSVATANVSGVAALLLAEKSSRTPEDIRAILVSTAKHLGATGINPQFGAGLVDPLRALQAAPPVAGRSAAAAPIGPVQQVAATR
jgi:filamentous hemagglutinin family protein